MVGVIVLSALAMLGGFMGGLVSSIGALLNTAQVEDKTCFILLLVLGLLSFGIVAMIAYVIAGWTEPSGRLLPPQSTPRHSPQVHGTNPPFREEGGFLLLDS